MNISKQNLVDDFKRVGILTGDILVVHSSLKSIGQVKGGALTVVDSLHEVVGDAGAAVFPCLTFCGSLTDYLRKTDYVDLRKVNISTGAIPRCAWNYPQSYRSIHPTHPVAILGKKALGLIDQTQNQEGPCGVSSPFYKAAIAGGKILMIGVNCSSNTTLHCIEELYCPYTFTGEQFDVRTIDFDGNSKQISVKGYCVGVTRKFTAVEPKLRAEGILEEVKIGQSRSMLIDAKKMMEKVSQWVQDDPWLLAEKVNA